MKIDSTIFFNVILAIICYKVVVSLILKSISNAFLKAVINQKDVQRQVISFRDRLKEKENGSTSRK